MKNGCPDLNRHGLFLTNNIFIHKGVHIIVHMQLEPGHSSMIDLVVVSSVLRPHVLDTRVKRGAELSTDRPLRMPGRVPLSETHLRESFNHVPK